MVPVPGGEYSLVGYGRPSEESARFDDFFIDQFEVSNREYQEFVDAGGYENRAYWKHPFVKDGQGILVGGRIGAFDRPHGKPGPRGSLEQRYPAGLDDHPVTGVTWYEAAAYAEFRGKSLPTVFQWEKAARDGQRTKLWGRRDALGHDGTQPEAGRTAPTSIAGRPCPSKVTSLEPAPTAAFTWRATWPSGVSMPAADGFTATGGSYPRRTESVRLVRPIPGILQFARCWGSVAS
jgi:formylglycine-generating enzyme required for sulfatase activity